MKVKYCELHMGVLAESTNSYLFIGFACILRLSLLSDFRTIVVEKTHGQWGNNFLLSLHGRRS